MVGACCLLGGKREEPAAQAVAQPAPTPVLPMQPSLSPGGMVPINPPSGGSYQATSHIPEAVRADLARDWCPNPRRMNRCPDWYVMFATGADRLIVTGGEGGLSAHVYTLIPQRDEAGQRIALQICQHVTVALARHSHAHNVVRVYRDGGRIIANSVLGGCTNGIF